MSEKIKKNLIVTQESEGAGEINDFNSKITKIPNLIEFHSSFKNENSDEKNKEAQVESNEQEKPKSTLQIFNSDFFKKKDE